MAIIEWAKVQAGTGAAFGGLTATTSAQQVGGQLPGRTSMTVWNNDASNTVFLGFGTLAAGVTSTTGAPLVAGASLPMDLGPGILVFAITASGTADVRWTESF